MTSFIPPSQPRNQTQEIKKRLLTESVPSRVASTARASGRPRPPKRARSHREMGGDLRMSSSSAEPSDPSIRERGVPDEACDELRVELRPA
jgi:hypothetical protein